MSTPIKSNWILARDLLGLMVALSFLVFVVIMLWEIFFPLVISVIIAYLLNPLIGIISHRFRLGRTTSVAVLYLGFFSLFGLSLWIMIPLVIKEISLVQIQFPVYMNYTQTFSGQVLDRLQQWFPALPLKNYDLMSMINPVNAFSGGLRNIPLIIKAIVNVAMNIILVPFVTFFLLKDGPILKKKLYELIPNTYYEMYRNLAYRMGQQLGNYIRGQAMDALICGMLSSLGLWFMGVKYFLLIGMVAGVANLIPYFGPVMGMIPAIIVTIIDKGLLPGPILAIVAMFVVVQLIDNLLINPVVVGNSVDLHPLVVMLAIMIGGALGGLFAMLLVVPFVSVMRIVIIEVANEYRYRKSLKNSLMS